MKSLYKRYLLTDAWIAVCPQATYLKHIVKVNNITLLNNLSSLHNFYFTLRNRYTQYIIEDLFDLSSVRINVITAICMLFPHKFVTNLCFENCFSFNIIILHSNMSPSRHIYRPIIILYDIIEYYVASQLHF